MRGGDPRLTQFCRHWQVVGGGVRVQTQRDVDQRLEQSDCHNGIQGGGGGVYLVVAPVYSTTVSSRCRRLAVHGSNV